MPFNPDNTRHKFIAESVHSEDRATFFSVTYNPLERTGTLMFQHFPHIFVNDGLVSIGKESGKIYREVQETIVAKPDSPLIDPITGANLSNVSGAGIQTWLEWFFDHLANSRS